MLVLLDVLHVTLFKYNPIKLIRVFQCLDILYILLIFERRNAKRTYECWCGILQHEIRNLSKMWSRKRNTDNNSKIKIRTSRQNMLIIKKGNELIWNNVTPNLQILDELIIVHPTSLQNERNFSTSGKVVRQ